MVITRGVADSVFRNGTDSNAAVVEHKARDVFAMSVGGRALPLREMADSPMKYRQQLLGVRVYLTDAYYHVFCDSKSLRFRPRAETPLTRDHPREI